MSSKFPFEIRDVPPKKNQELLKQLRGEQTGFVQVGPKGYFFPQIYKGEAHNLYNMAVRPSDVFVATFPRSGTTWTQVMVWMVANDLDYDKAETMSIWKLFPYLDFKLLNHPETMNTIKKMKHNEKNKRHLAVLHWVYESITTVSLAPSPRFIKTHVPFSLLPPSLIDTARAVYVARDPRDVAVSYYHLCKMCTCLDFHEDFKEFWKLFVEDFVHYSPYFEHLKEAWEKRNHPNMLFLFYEDMNKDLPAVIRRVAKFLDKEYSEDQIGGLCKHLHIENLKKNNICRTKDLYDVGIFRTDGEPFVRKGKSGGWREYFDAEMAAQAQAWIDENLRGSDFRFPHLGD